MAKKYEKVIIIGAPRSGTNMLRDVLCSLDNYGTWPCDEINYIWRHGNITLEHDEFNRDLIKPEIKKYIQNKFDKLAKKQNLRVLVEKTCANSLRVPFVDKMIPDAKYIFIYRDGMDVVGSAAKRWKAPLDVPYLIKKARYVPLFDLPYYAFNYSLNRVYRLFSKEGRLAFWGPRYIGIDNDLKKYTLDEVGALQWQHCIQSSEKAFLSIDKNKISRVSYEDFVINPEDELKRVLNELELSYDKIQVKSAVQKVSSKSVGKGRNSFDNDNYIKVHSKIANTLRKYNYE